jgi:acyl carrier protein phosphodiesterase
LDHLIAKNWNNLFDKRFDEFTSEVSKVIMSEFERLPMPVGGIMQRMATADWLKSGETETGIIKVYKRLSEKASTALEGSEVLKIYHKNTEFYDELLIDFVKMNRDLVMNNYPGINLRIEWKN